MGVMKRIATNQDLLGSKNFSRFAPGEREAIRNLIRGSEGLLKFLAEEAAPPPTAGGIRLDEVFIRLSFTGFKPERAGKYLVVDMVSETQQYVSLDRIADGWMVLPLGAITPTKFEEYNRQTFRWFLFADLGQDDVAFIRKSLTPLALA